MYKTVVLVILDGYGRGPENAANAIFKAKNGFSSKEDAIRYVLSKYFKIKFLDAYKENDGDDVSIKRGL